MKVRRFATESGWIEAAVEELAALLRARPDARLCLPTGLTPLRFYARAVEEVKAGRLSFARAEVFLLDEFGGTAADDPGRCDRTLRRALIDHIDLPAASFHTFDPDAPDVDRMCRDYEAAIASGGLDLVILGVGTNGHIGMNEPGSPMDSVTRRVTLAPSTIAASARYFSHDRLPTWGVTIGIGTILRARAVHVFASGSSKAPIVGDAIEGAISEENPASLLRHHPDCTWFCDEAAAMLLGPGEPTNDEHSAR